MFEQITYELCVMRVCIFVKDEKCTFYIHCVNKRCIRSSFVHSFVRLVVCSSFVRLFVR